jgi:cell division initiation protein
MPDQNSAAREHALLSEIAEPLARLPEDPVQFTADVEFPVALRGYDRVAVDAYVRRTCQLVAELQARTSPQAAIRRAVERFGEEVSGILERAHETAAEITARSRREAEERLERARREAQELLAAAQERVRQLDADTDRIWEERARIIADARELARQLADLAEGASRPMETATTPALLDTPVHLGVEVVDLAPDAEGGTQTGLTPDAEGATRADVEPGSGDEAEIDYDIMASGQSGIEDSTVIDADAAAEAVEQPTRPFDAQELEELDALEAQDEVDEQATIAIAPPPPQGPSSDAQPSIGPPFDFESEHGGPAPSRGRRRGRRHGHPGPLGFDDPPGEQIAARPGLDPDRLV